MQGTCIIWYVFRDFLEWLIENATQHKMTPHYSRSKEFERGAAQNTPSLGPSCLPSNIEYCSKVVKPTGFQNSNSGLKPLMKKTGTRFR